MTEFSIYRNVIFALSCIFFLSYLVFIGTLMYELYVAPNPTGCATPQAWAFIGGTIIFLFIISVLAAYLTWALKNKEETINPKHKLLKRSLMIIFILIALSGITLFTSAIFA